MNCELIAIGTELLLGNIANTNGKFLSNELANIGINVYRHTVVGDNKDRLIEVIDDAFKRCDLIITTGGLGPTKDDLTKEAISEYFDCPLELFEDEKAKLEGLFKNSNYVLSQNNYRQVYFPKDSIPLNNNHGTASGCLIEKNGKYLAMLPGPPKECTNMYRDSLLPHLLKFSEDIFISKYINFIGIGESQLEEMLLPLIERQTNPTIAPYAKGGYVSIRVTAKCKNAIDGEKLIEPITKEIQDLVEQNIYSYEDITPPQALVNLLLEKNLTISSAESITGGLFASSIISISNASKVINESYITYSNEAKTRILGVSEDTLKKHGAVSPEVAKEMAIGLKKATGADIAVSFTGIAGPTGETKEKPVGLVYIGINYKNNTYTYKYNFRGNRDNVRNRCIYSAIYEIFKLLKEK